MKKIILFIFALGILISCSPDTELQTYQNELNTENQNLNSKPEMTSYRYYYLQENTSTYQSPCTFNNVYEIYLSRPADFDMSFEIEYQIKVNNSWVLTLLSTGNIFYINEGERHVIIDMCGAEEIINCEGGSGIKEGHLRMKVKKIEYFSSGSSLLSPFTNGGPEWTNFTLKKQC